MAGHVPIHQDRTMFWWCALLVLVVVVAVLVFMDRSGNPRD
jgi:hypothetical protein